MRDVPSLAVNAAHDTLRQGAVITLLNAAARLRGEESPHIEHALVEVQEATQATAEFLALLPSVESAVLGRLTAVLHVMDHVSQCARDAEWLAGSLRLRKMAALRAQADHLSALFMTGAAGLTGSHPEELASVMQQLEQAHSSGADARPAILLSATRHALDIEDALDGLDVQRALDRLRHHAGGRCTTSISSTSEHPTRRHLPKWMYEVSSDLQ